MTAALKADRRGRRERRSGQPPQRRAGARFENVLLGRAGRRYTFAGAIVGGREAEPLPEPSRPF